MSEVRGALGRKKVQDVGAHPPEATAEKISAPMVRSAAGSAAFDFKAAPGLGLRVGRLEASSEVYEAWLALQHARADRGPAGLDADLIDDGALAWALVDSDFDSASEIEAAVFDAERAFEDAAVQEAERWLGNARAVAQDLTLFDEASAQSLDQQLSPLLPLAQQIVRTHADAARFAPGPVFLSLQAAAPLWWQQLQTALAPLLPQYPWLQHPALDPVALILEPAPAKALRIQGLGATVSAQVERLKGADLRDAVYRWEGLKTAILAGQGPVMARIVQEKTKRLSDDHLLDGLVAGAASILAPPVGLVAGAAVLAKSTDRYQIDSAAHRAHVDQAQQLAARDPGLGWLLLEALGVGLDAAVVLKGIQGAVAALDSSQGLDAAQSLAKELGQHPDTVSVALQHAAERLRLAEQVRAQPWAQALLARHPGLPEGVLGGLGRLSASARAGLLAHLGDDLLRLSKWVLASEGPGALGLHRAAQSPRLLRAVLASDAEPRLLARMLGQPGVTASHLEAAVQNLGRAKLTWVLRHTLPLLPEDLGRMARQLGVMIVHDATLSKVTLLPGLPPKLVAPPQVTGQQLYALLPAIKAVRGADQVVAEATELLGKVRATDLEAEAALETIIAQAKQVPLSPDPAASLARVRQNLAAEKPGIVDHYRVRQLADNFDHAFDQALKGHVLRRLDGVPHQWQRGKLQIQSFDLSANEVLLLAQKDPVAFDQLVALLTDLKALDIHVLPPLTAEQLKQLVVAVGHAEARQLGTAGRLLPNGLDALVYQVGRLRHLRQFPQLDDVRALDGKTWLQVQSSPPLKHTLETWYTVTQDGVVRRKPNTADWVPQLKLDDQKLRFAFESDPPIVLPKGTAAELEPFLALHAPSWVGWRQTLENLGATESEIHALITQAVQEGAQTVASLRHALKSATRERLVDHCFAGSDAHPRLMQLSATLDPADAGQLAERWYRRYAEVYRGQKLESHPELLAAHNPSLAGKRIPDNLWVHGNQLGEVKNTRLGLAARDIEQVEAILTALSKKNGATVIRPDGTKMNVTSLRLTFTDPRGALGSAKKLEEWLDRFENLKVEVFDIAGNPHFIETTTLSELHQHGKSLRDLLDSWTRK